jgi:hypothetical protein
VTEGDRQHHLAFDIVFQAFETASCYLSIVQTWSSQDSFVSVCNNLHEVEAAPDLLALPNALYWAGGLQLTAPRLFLQLLQRSQRMASADLKLLASFLIKIMIMAEKGRRAIQIGSCNCNIQPKVFEQKEDTKRGSK